MSSQRPVHVRCAAAFTLLELLLAMAVFAVVLTAINTVFFGALRLTNKTQATFDRSLPLHQTLALLRRDLRGLRPPPADTNALFSGQFQNTSEPSTVLASFGVRVTPDLYTTTGAIDEFTPFANVQKVAYFLVNPTNNNADGFELTRVISRDLAPVNEETFDQQFLMEGVANVQLQFFDGSVWTDVWDSTVTSNLPTAVRVQLILATNAQAYLNAPIELVVPILADVLTNTVTTTTTTDDSGGGGGGGGNNNGGGNTGGGGGGNTGGGGGGNTGGGGGNP